METSLISMTVKVQKKLTSIWKVVHPDLFWNRGNKKLGNGLLVHQWKQNWTGNNLKSMQSTGTIFLLIMHFSPSLLRTATRTE